ncbi:glycosyltransferase family 4 protein [Patescibacteria group bacterium]|nr:glycosyltransferase family 4 protein [Patescibacteria group bacterium]MBU1722118.1 glycosyltransferase family 4 protein [Patescibacteria group bacterium]MBU1901167.1 glycosyltransferase family 4 protein [Patescibacteria group bacterium]
MGTIFLCVNSDIGRGNTIGFRFGKIASELKKKHKKVHIIARANYSELEVCIPWYKNILGRVLNAIRIYIFPSLHYRPLEIYLFDRFVLQQLKKEKYLYTVAHFGEGLPKSIEYLKKKGVQIYLDMPMGYDGYTKYLRKKGIHVGNGNQDVLTSLTQAIELSDVIVVPSVFVKETVKNAGFTNKDYALVPFGANNVKKYIEKKQNKKVKFLFAGNVNYRKGILYLLQAWRKAGFQDAELHICGRVYKEIQEEIKKYTVGNIFFHGFVDLKEYFIDADIFVFPSLLEGSAKVVYEAMSYSLPVITTDNSGSIVEDGKHGYIVPIADVNSLVEKMKYLYNHEDIRIKLGIAANKHVQKFTWEHYGEQVIELYTKE